MDSDMMMKAPLRMKRLPVVLLFAGVLFGPVPHPARAQDAAKHEPTQEERYLARFPQPAKVGHLIGLPVLDGQDRTIGYVRDVAKTPDGKIKLIVPYNSWFGWVSYRGVFDAYRKPVAVPLETVAILGYQIDALDMSRADFDKAPAWSAQDGTSLSRDDTVRIGVQRR